MPYFQIYRDNRREWRWRFRTGNHETIAVSSEGYINKSDCRHSIDLVKRHAPGARVDELD